MDPVRTLIGLGAIGSGLWAIGRGVRDLLRSRAAAYWPAVPGRIVSAGAVRRNTGMHAGRGIYHEARVVYEYESGGRKFTGTRIHAGGEVWIGAGSAGEILRRYPAGSEVSVYADPVDPSRACLDPGGAAWLVNLAAGLAAIGFGIAVMKGWILGG